MINMRMINFNQYRPQFSLQLILYILLPIILLGGVYGFYDYSKKPYENNQEWLGRQISLIYQHLGIELQYLHLSGNKYITLQKINNILNINDKVPINNLDINLLHNHIVRIGWVKDARLERHFPNELHITINERVPKAWFESQRQYYLIDDLGAIIDARDNMDHHIINDIDALGLPIISGIGAPVIFDQLFYEINNVINQSGRANDLFISHGDYISKRRWNITLNNRAILLLPQDNYLDALSKIIALKHDVPIMQHHDIVVDLRDKQRILISSIIKSTQKNKASTQQAILEITAQQLQSMAITPDNQPKNDNHKPFLIMPIEAIEHHKGN